MEFKAVLSVLLFGAGLYVLASSVYGIYWDVRGKAFDGSSLGATVLLWMAAAVCLRVAWKLAV